MSYRAPLSLPLVATVLAVASGVGGGVTLTAAEAIAAVQPSAPGARTFSAVPAPGVHPRIFISPEDLPALRRDVQGPARTKHYERLRKAFTERLDNPSTPEGRVLAVMASGGLPTDAQFAAASDLGTQLHLAGIDALITEDAARGALLAKVLSAYGAYQLRTWVRKPDPVGLHNSFDTGFALAYDYVAPWMDEAQRAPARDFISKMADGIHIFTWDWPPHMRMWNWAGLHTYQGWASLAIEGEPGWKPDLWNEAKTVVRDFCRSNIHASGALTEDITYFSFAMRGVGPGLVAMARRGEADVLGEGSNYAKLKYHLVNQLQPWGGPNFMSHQDGGGAGFYAMWTFHKYLYPQDPIVDVTYRNRVGDDYDTMVGGNDGDTRTWATVLFNTPADATARTPADLGLPTTYFCPTRSYLIARSGWEKDAVKLDFEAKTDYPTVGHNHADANNFTLAALGREWATEVGYHGAAGHLHNNIVIDGRSQSGWPTPGGHWVDLVDTPEATIGVSDARHAYTWQWTNSGWGTENTPPSSAMKWERETLPEVLAFVREQAESGQGRQSIFEHHGPVLRGEWNPVEKAFRTAALVRGPRPYVVIADDIRKDDRTRLYEWAMQMPEDVELLKSEGRRVILGAKDLPPAKGKDGKDEKPQPDKRRLLVQVLDVDLPNDRDALAIAVESTSLGNDAFSSGKVRKRLVIPARTVEPRFKILLYPHREGDALPDVLWNDERTAVDLIFLEHTDRLAFADAAAGRTALRLSRDGRDLATVAAAPAAPQVVTTSRVFTDRLEVTLAPPGPAQELRYTTDGSAPTATSPLYTGPLSLTATTTLKVVTVARRWAFGSQRVSQVTEATFTRQDLQPAASVTGTAPGLTAQVYAGFWDRLPDFRTFSPLATSAVERVTLPPGTPSKGFGVVLEGLVRIPADGVYRFGLTCDDAGRLWIGDRLVVDHDGQHIVSTQTGEIALQAGLHRLRIAHADGALRLGTGMGDGSWAFQALWAPAGAALVEIPAEALVRVGGPDLQAATVPSVAAVTDVRTVAGLEHRTALRPGLRGTPAFFEVPATVRSAGLAANATTSDDHTDVLHVLDGYLQVPVAGIYEFTVDASTVAEVSVGEVVVVRTGTPGHLVNTPVRLAAGPVPYRVKLGTGPAQVRWKGPGQAWQPVMAEDVARALRPLAVIADRPVSLSGYELVGPTTLTFREVPPGTTVAVTLDGRDPAVDGQVVDGSLTVTSAGTLRARLRQDGQAVGEETRLTLTTPGTPRDLLTGWWSPRQRDGLRLVNGGQGAADLVLPEGTPLVDDPAQGPAFRLEHAGKLTLNGTGLMANEATLSFRLKPEADDGVLVRYGYAHHGIFMDLKKNGSVLASGGGVWTGASAKPGALTDGRWHEVTATFGGSPFRAITLWIDGVQVASVRSKAPCVTNALDFFQSCSGLFADVRLYNRLLSPAEIAALAQDLPKP